MTAPVTLAAIDEDALASAESVWLFTDETIPAVAVSVCALTFAVSPVMSDCTASEPLESDAPVKVRVPLFQMSDTSAPKVVSERPE